MCIRWRTTSLVFKTDDRFGPMSRDEKYVLLSERPADADDGPAALKVLDLGSCMTSPVMKVRCEEPSVWVGESHAFAAIGADGNVWVCEVTRGRKGVPDIAKRALTSGGDCIDLRLATGGGLYFTRRSEDDRRLLLHGPQGCYGR